MRAFVCSSGKGEAGRDDAHHASASAVSYTLFRATLHFPLEPPTRFMVE